MINEPIQLGRRVAFRIFMTVATFIFLAGKCPTAHSQQPKAAVTTPAPKADSKPTTGQNSHPDETPKLKAQIAALQIEIAALKLRITTLDLEKLGAIVGIDKTKDGKEVITVNILKKWSGEKDALQLLKNIPNVQIIYIDNGQVNDSTITPLKDLSSLSALTLMSPQITDSGLANIGGLTNLSMLFLTGSKISDKGLSQLKGLKNLQVLALSRTEVTDSGLEVLKDMKSLKSLYVIGTKITPGAIDKFKQALPGVAVYK